MNRLTHLVLLALSPAYRRRRRARRAAWDIGVRQVIEAIGKRATIGGDPYWITITGHTPAKITGAVWTRNIEDIAPVRDQVRSSVWEQARRPEDD